MKIVDLFLLFLLNLNAIKGNKEYSFVILSQRNDFNLGSANQMKAQICEQASVLGKECPPVYLSHKDFPHVGDWTVIPILKDIYDVVRNSSWLIIIEDRTVIRLDVLMKILTGFDHTKKLWIGHALEDDNPTIVHHFNDLKLKYPHMGAGVAITIPLVQKLTNRISVASKLTDFSIDRAFELALFVWNEGDHTSLIHNNAFCSRESKQCASFPQNFEACESPISRESIYFTVKTCQKFHSDRVPVVLNTWAKYAKRLDFISDFEDNSIPTISLGVPNTESGHCGKTMGIINYLHEKIENDGSIEWIMIVDDDTILSVQRLSELLSCYNSGDDIAIGERYGYGVYNSHGYNYITGGGGMIFSRTLLKKLTSSCKCPSISSPDDMILGHCLANLGVSITHSHLFHQARPMDYSKKFLESDKHISFHKHWMIDPLEVYKNWFEKEDLKLVQHTDMKVEL